MSYEYITKYDSKNFGYGGRGTHGQNVPKEIIVHHWGVDGQKFQNVINYFLSKNCQTSAHYVLEDGKVACLVNCADAAWHAGDMYVNMHSIGIECRPECTKGDLETLSELIADIWKVYGKLPLRGHKDVVATDCPGRYYNKLGSIKKRAEEIYSGVKASSAKPKPKPKPKKKSVHEVAKEVINGDWGNGKAREDKLKKAGYDPKEVQKEVNKILAKPKQKPKKKSVHEVAKEVINGDWGNGKARINNLKEAGYDPDEVQRVVNSML